MENAIIRINEENPAYTSMTVTTKEERKAFYNAVENPDHKLSEFINKKITFSNVSMEMSQVQARDDAGNPIPDTFNPAVKTVLVTPDGKGIISTSMGVARALYSMFQIFGTPDTWDEPMTCIVKQVEIGKNRTFKLEVV